MFATSDMIRQWNENGKAFTPTLDAVPTTNLGAGINVNGAWYTWDSSANGGAGAYVLIGGGDGSVSRPFDSESSRNAYYAAASLAVGTRVRVGLTWTEFVGPTNADWKYVDDFHPAGPYNYAPISSLIAQAQSPLDVATINPVTNGSTIIGFAGSIRCRNGYALLGAKVSSDYKSVRRNRYKISIKSDYQTDVYVRITSGSGWGPSPATSIYKEELLHLSASNANTRSIIIDCDLASVFYATPGVQQEMYVLLAADGLKIPNKVQFVLIVEDITDESPIYRKSIPYITGWGDSLTAGGGWTDTLAALVGCPFFNGGTGGENSATILARQGGDAMIVNDITIPATTTPVVVASRPINGGIKTELGATVTPLLQGGAHINPCVLANVKGTLAWTGSDYYDPNGTWTFTRSEAGIAVTINRPRVIRTRFDLDRNAGLQIIFMGQNGGYSSDADLVRQHKLMIAHSTAKATIVLGLSSGSAASRLAYESAMRAEFGRYFISLREYLSKPIYSGAEIISCYGLDDAGITPTASDLDAIATGKVPPSLLSDSVHYNAACKTVIGNMLYRKIQELNIL